MNTKIAASFFVAASAAAHAQVPLTIPNEAIYYGPSIAATAKEIDGVVSQYKAMVAAAPNGVIPVADVNPTPNRLYGAQAVEQYNAMVQLQFNLMRDSVSMYRRCMEMKIAIIQKGGAPNSDCTMPVFPPIPPLQWQETTPERSQ